MVSWLDIGELWIVKVLKLLPRIEDTTVIQFQVNGGTSTDVWRWCCHDQFPHLTRLPVNECFPIIEQKLPDCCICCMCNVSLFFSASRPRRRSLRILTAGPASHPPRSLLCRRPVDRTMDAFLSLLEYLQRTFTLYLTFFVKTSNIFTCFPDFILINEQKILVEFEQNKIITIFR